MTAALDIFLATHPGLEPLLAGELAEAGFAGPRVEAGGVTVRGGWREVWRANLEIRGASRVLVRLDSFRAVHLAQLDKRARKAGWAGVLRPDVPVRVDAVCRGSRIYHSGAAAERVATAITETIGAPVRPDAALRVLVRIEDDLVTLSLDTSGELLHRRGHKQAVARAPLRESLAALFLRACGYEAGESLLDPMCGSGTFVIEAAEIAAGLAPGRSRAFAFEQLANVDAEAWAQMREAGGRPARTPQARFFGFDRDAGAIRMSGENAARAGVAAFTRFERGELRALRAPDVPPGLVIVNPPYGARIGERKALMPLYRTLGAVLRSGFSGWRVGIVTSDTALAKATGLPFAEQGPPVDHGGLKIRLHRTAPLR
ncbi:class I SAM-dependent RNA methyltransferase [Marinicauda algicola]|uniref:Class I SAM-dependent RNA methyltransferase n=1 Tax=Marinicauda algicola TaxID=2029849 RepID=A0A4S2H253_9PROT|nr:class I SAM-dependent RNA methyltransferase [Marinicauda algicola]TGY89351.1 class I SAM-dependent RNA methyltransferase [Marinicauda algicola]